MASYKQFPAIIEEVRICSKYHINKIQLTKNVAARLNIKKDGISTLIEVLIANGDMKRVGRQVRWNNKVEKATGEAKFDQKQYQAESLKLIESLKKINDNKQKQIEEKDGQVEELKKQLSDKSDTIHEVHITDLDGTKREMKATFHPKFKQILALAQARKNIFIYGPTGSGKSFVCGQIAEALGLPFYFVSCTAGMSEGQLAGRLLPVGEQGTFEYVISEFVKAYEEGGVFLLDELDAADPNVLLLVNAALANGRLALPNRPEKPYAIRHKDFVCIAAANTVGTGGDRMYSGRNKLDGSTLDRFMIGKVNLDYDRSVEEQLCPDADLRKMLWRVRDGINENRLERAMSTRFMIDAYEMKEAGWTHEEIMAAFFTGWREDEVGKVRSHWKDNS